MTGVRRVIALLVVLSVAAVNLPLLVFPVPASAAANCPCAKVRTQDRPYVDPDTRDPATVKPKINADGTSPKGTYRVSANQAGLTVSRLKDASGIPLASPVVVLQVGFANTNVGWGFSPDENRFEVNSATGGMETVTLYDLTLTTANKQIWTTSGLFASSALAFSPGGKYFLFAGIDAQDATTLSIVAVSTHQVVYSLNPLHLSTAHWGFSPDDDRFVYETASGNTGVVTLRDLAANRTVWTSQAAVGSAAAAFSPHGKYFLYAAVDNGNHTTLTVVKADAASSPVVYQTDFNFQSVPGSGSDSQGVAGWGFSPDDNDASFVFAAVTGQSSSAVTLVNVGSPARPAPTTRIALVNVVGAFWQFSPCGDILAVVSQTNQSYVEVRLYQVATPLPALADQQFALGAVTLRTTKTGDQIATIGGTDHVLARATPAAQCSSGNGTGNGNPGGNGGGIVVGGSEQANVTLSGITISPASVSGGTALTGVVQASIPSYLAPNIWFGVVHLASSNPAVAAVPQDVLVYVPSPNPPFPITTFPATADTIVTITGTTPNSTQQFSARLLVTAPCPNAQAAVAPAAQAVVAPAALPVAPIGGNGGGGDRGRNGPLASLTVAPLHGSAGDHLTGTLTLDRNPTGTTVALSAGQGATVPASLTLPAGTTSTTFDVALNTVTADTFAMVRAISGNVLVQEVLVEAPRTPASVTFDPSSVLGGNGSTGTVTLSAPAGACSAPVTLTSDNPAATSVPQSVSIPEGATSATFAVATSAVTTDTTVHVTAGHDGGTAQGTLTLTAGVVATPPPSLASLTVGPTQVSAGQAAVGTVTLDAAAPAGGVTAQISSDNPAASVPPSVTVPAGQASATFPIQTSAVTGLQTATITVTAGGLSRTATLAVAPALTPPPTQIITTYAGGTSNDPSQYPVGLPALAAWIGQPTGVATGASGDLYVSDYRGSAVYRVAPSGVLTVIANSGTPVAAPFGSLTMSGPSGFAIDATGNLYVADQTTRVVFKIAPGGAMSVVAGNGIYTADGNAGNNGSATSVGLGMPIDVKLDAAGNLYVLDYANMVVRKVTPGGTISTVVGVGQGNATGTPVCYNGGDGGSATDAHLCWPQAISFDGAGNLYIADYGDHVIRKVDTGGTISTVAGNGSDGYSGDGGDATAAAIGAPAGVVAAADGSLLVTDDLHGVVRMVSASGTITTAAGTGTRGYTGDGGPADQAQLYAPTCITRDSSGAYYFCDTPPEAGNGGIVRRVGMPVQLFITPTQSTVPGGNPLDATVTLPGPAPAGGTTVTLASSAPGVATVPPTVVVLAGQTSVGFAVQTTAVGADTPVIVTGSAGALAGAGLVNVAAVGGPPLTVGDPVDVSNTPGSSSNAPVVAADGSNVYVAWLEGSSTGPVVDFGSSADAGASFGTPAQMGTPVGDPPAIAAAAGSVYLAWRGVAAGQSATNANAHVLFWRSAGAGGTLDPAVELNQLGIQSEDVRVAASGSHVYVAWWEQASGNLILRASSDGGVSFGGPAVLANVPTYNSDDSLRLAASGGAVYVAWNDTQTWPAVANTYFTASTDGGAHFTAVVNLSEETRYDATNPELAVANGRLYVAWRVVGDPNMPQTRHLYVRVSASDNGATFDPKVDLMPSMAFTYNVGAAASLRLAASGSDVYVAWWSQVSGPGIDSTTPNRLFLASSHDQGATFGSPSGIQDEVLPQIDPALVTASGQDVYVAWSRHYALPSGYGSTEVRLRRSTDAAATFGDSLLIGAPPATYQTASFGNAGLFGAGNNTYVVWRTAPAQTLSDQDVFLRALHETPLGF